MLTMHEQERLLELLRDEEREVRTQGLELVQALPGDERKVIADLLVRRSEWPQWEIAARCVMGERRADRRLRLFAARCALYRLERERAAGREPDEEAWRAVEMAERYARGTLRERDRRRMAKRLEDWWVDWDWEYAAPWAMAFDSVDFEAVPDGDAWEDSWELGVGVGLTPEEQEGAEIEEELDAMYGAHRAAAVALTRPEIDEEEEWSRQSFVPEAGTREERRVQRRLWRAVVLRGEDGLAEVFGRASC